MKRETSLIGASVLTTLTASLCCITPVLAIIAGTTGLTSTFSWLMPFRPYLIGLTLLMLGIAWYQKLISSQETDCDCDSETKRKFITSKTFLGLVTAFAIVMLAFPYYSGNLFASSERQIVGVKNTDIRKSEFKVRGMTCASCEVHINREVERLNGILVSKASFENGNAIIEFDQTKTNEQEIVKAINSAGYKVITESED